MNNLNLKAQNVCFTFNNPTNEDIEAIQNMLRAKTSYAVYGIEVGAGGTMHLQGYYEIGGKSGFRISVMRKWFPRAAAHLERRNGTSKQAIAYCKKGDQSHSEWELDGTSGLHYGRNASVWEHGVPHKPKEGQGKRTDIEVVRDSIMGGEVKNEFELLMTVTSMQSLRYGQMLLNSLPSDPVRAKPIVYWLYGSTGTGKSRACAEIISRFQKMRGWSFWRSNLGTDWFDGYARQEVVWFDDFRFNGRTRDFAFLLNLLDVYPMRVPIKGGFVNWTPRVILFTAPRPTQVSFGDVEGREELGQLQRRITREFDFDGDGGVEFAMSIWSYLNEPESDHVAVQRWDLLPDFGDDDSDSDYDDMSVEEGEPVSPAGDEGDENEVPEYPPRLLRSSRVFEPISLDASFEEVEEDDNCSEISL